MKFTASLVLVRELFVPPAGRVVKTLLWYGTNEKEKFNSVCNETQTRRVFFILVLIRE